ncbi:hypothetical protein [Micromonospora sp. WMMD710]|uniref:hypothetical protein n=1 Tax=Micromonospora sp. WMMD710 TaxID=3016085 RepID=UPI0024167BED|nr:hypothetical protein [Micromonospora sp. WMMD710]MDG4759655.1 hypothetical protein [Micromonospora sp. WMMD710]
MLTVSDRLPEHELFAGVSRGANNASETINHTSHEGTWRPVSVGPVERASISPAEAVDRDAQLLGSGV